MTIIDICANNGSNNNNNSHYISEYFRKLVRAIEPFEYYARTHGFELRFIVANNEPTIKIQNKEITILINLYSGELFSDLKNDNEENRQKYHNAIGEAKTLANHICKVARFDF